MNSEYSLPGDFYKEEIRCDFLVSSKRKSVWAIQLMILNKFKEICAKHNLKYFAIDGTLLGAVRHNGFIPWDDDIDVCMPRKDYEVFLKVAFQELKNSKNLVIQESRFDPKYSTPHARITDINTTAYFPHIWKSGLELIQGIFIDIFPFDNVPNSIVQKKIHRFVYKTISYMLHDKQNMYTYENSSLPARILRFLSRILFSFCSVDSVLIWTQKYIQKYNSDSSCRSFGPIATFYQLDQEIVEKGWFDELIELPFENTSIVCPKRFEEVLEKTYGDWKKLIKGASCHEGCFYDPKRPYTFYRDKDILNYSNEL